MFSLWNIYQFAELWHRPELRAALSDSKNGKEAKFSALFGGYLFIPVSMVFFMIGTALYAYYKMQPELLPDHITGDSVFPYFIVHGLPTGVTGLLIASIFAAGMSTVATSVTSSATIILTDYYKRFACKHLQKSNRCVYCMAQMSSSESLGLSCVSLT